MARSGTDLIRQWLEGSPFVGKLGISVQKLEPDLAVLVLPFDPSLATIGDVVGERGGVVPAVRR